MTQPGPAQMDLIRRYARTLRELHADAMRTRPLRTGPRVLPTAKAPSKESTAGTAGSTLRPT